MLILSKSTNKMFISSHLSWLKYFLMITWKSDMWSKHNYIIQTKLLVKRAGFTVYRCDLCHRVNFPRTATPGRVPRWVDQFWACGMVLFLLPGAWGGRGKGEGERLGVCVERGGGDVLHICQTGPLVNNKGNFPCYVKNHFPVTFHSILQYLPLLCILVAC